MENPLAKLDRANLPAPPNAGKPDEDYLARVNQCWGISRPVTEGKAKPGDFFLQPQGLNLGTEFDALIIHYNWSAIEFDAGSTLITRLSGGDEIKEHLEYQRIVKAAGKKGAMGCQHGKHVLLYLFKQQCFAGYLFGKKTDRNIGINRVAVPDKQMVKQNEEMMEKVYAKKLSPDQTVTEIMDLFQGPLFRCGVRFKTIKTPSKYRDSQGSLKPTTFFTPELTFLPSQVWTADHEAPNAEDCQVQIDKFMEKVVYGVEEEEKAPALPGERPR